MSVDRALEPVTPEAEQPLGHEHGPRALGDRQLLDLLQIKSARFYALKAQGAFRFLELKPQVVGMSTRYSRAVVDRWLAGEDVSAPLSRTFFGQKSAAAVAAKSRRGRRPGQSGGAKQGIAMFERNRDVSHGAKSAADDTAEKGHL